MPRFLLTAAALFVLRLLAFVIQAQRARRTKASLANRRIALEIEESWRSMSLSSAACWDPPVDRGANLAFAAPGCQLGIRDTLAKCKQRRHFALKIQQAGRVDIKMRL
jgi:hypothetical protein